MEVSHKTFMNVFLHRCQIRVFFFLYRVMDLLRVQKLLLTATSTLSPGKIPLACIHSAGSDSREYVSPTQDLAAGHGGGVSNRRVYAGIRPLSIRFMFCASCRPELRSVTTNTPIFRKWTCYRFWVLWKVTVNCRVYLTYTVIHRYDMKTNYSSIHRYMRIYNRVNPHNVMCINTDNIYMITHWISFLLFVATKWESVVNSVYVCMVR
jgi:hypothetical protein